MKTYEFTLVIPAVADVEGVGVRPVRVQMELSAAAPSGG